MAGLSAPAAARPGAVKDSGLELQVDRIACDGYGMCAELLPEMIQLDEWGFPIVRPGPIPTGLIGHARRAVDVCPVVALRLRAARRERGK